MDKPLVFGGLAFMIVMILFGVYVNLTFENTDLGTIVGMVLGGIGGLVGGRAFFAGLDQ